MPDASPSVSSPLISHPQDVPFRDSARNVGHGLLLSSAFAVAGGLVMGGGKLLSTARQSKKEGGRFAPDWSETIEAAVTSARASWTAGGFAAFLFPNALKFGIGRGFSPEHLAAELQKGTEAASQASKLISGGSRLAKMLDKTGTRELLDNRWGQAAILGSVVGIAGGMAVFCQRLTDTAMTRWKHEEGFVPDLKKSARSAVKVAGIGLLAGGAASFLFKRQLGITI